MALTTFNNIKAAEVQIVLDAFWKDPQWEKTYMPRANALRAILENQTAVITPLEDPIYKRDVSVKWVDFCGDTSADGADADDCATPSGAEGTGKTKPYALDIFVTDTLAISYEELEAAPENMYNEIVATGTAAKIKNILEAFDRKVIAAVAANAGNNPYAGGGGPYVIDNGATKSTVIPGDQFGARKIIPYMMMVAEYNRGGSPFILDGGNLFQDYYIAPKEARNADGKLVDALYEDLPYRHDLIGFAALGLQNSTFLIDRGTFAIANRAKFTSPLVLAKQNDGGWVKTDNAGTFMRYTIDLNIPSITKSMSMVTQGAMKKDTLKLDVQYSVKCVGGKLIGNWFFKLRAAVLTNPLRCDVNNTGVIQLIKGDA